MNFYEISIQKFLEHLESIDTSLITIAGALKSIAYDCSYYNLFYKYENGIHKSFREHAINNVDSIINRERN